MCQRVGTAPTELTESGVILSERIREVSRRHSTYGNSRAEKKKKTPKRFWFRSREGLNGPRKGLIGRTSSAQRA